MRLPIRLAALIAASVSAAGAQQSANIPIRQVAIEATSDEVFNTTMLSAWQWSDGSFILSQRGRNGRLLRFDRDLKLSGVIADSSLVPGQPAFAQFVAFPYRADTTVVVDGANSALILVDRNGKQVRLLALPRPTDRNNIGTGQFGNFIDPQGRLVYRTAYGRVAGASPVQGTLDSSVIVRADFERRTVDTLMALRTLLAQQVIASETDGTTTVRTVKVTTNTWSDDWAVLTDGSIAMVRVQDYHIDWLYPDGTTASTPKMPFDWRRLSDEEKQAKLDSLRRGSRTADTLRRPSRPEDPPMMITNKVFATVAEVPDYYPALRGAARLNADANNRLWIAPSTSLQARGGLLMDVVNNNGVIEERVQLPAGAAIVGFGLKGELILRVPAAAPNMQKVARARVIR